MQPPLKGFIERAVNHIISFDILSINQFFLFLAPTGALGEVFS